MTGKTREAQARPTAYRSMLQLCPYTHLWRVVKVTVKDRKLPAAARQGATIALLGLFCPLFWTALFTGASRNELMFHATHSGLFVVLGVVVMLVGMMRK